MRLLPAALLLLASACSHTPTPEQAPGGARFVESATAADMRARILRHGDDVHACYQEAAAAHPVRAHEASAALFYQRAVQRFAFAAPSKEPEVKATPLTPFRVAFEACLGPRVAAWQLPLSPTDENPGLRFHFLPAGMALPPPLDFSKGVPDFGPHLGMDPEASSLLFDEAGVRGYVDISEMTRPRRLGGAPMRYTDEAMALRTEGTMHVRCIITREGVLRDCAVLESLPGLDRMVLQTLTTYRYTPVRYRGRPIQVSYTFTFNFKLPKS